MYRSNDYNAYMVSAFNIINVGVLVIWVNWFWHVQFMWLFAFENYTSIYEAKTLFNNQSIWT